MGLERKDYGITVDREILFKIYCKVFGKHPPRETGDVDGIRMIVIVEFKKVISSFPNLPKAVREALLKCLREPFCKGENVFREVMGLKPLQGEEDDKET